MLKSARGSGLGMSTDGTHLCNQALDREIVQAPRSSPGATSLLYFHGLGSNDIVIHTREAALRSFFNTLWSK